MKTTHGKGSEASCRALPDLNQDRHESEQSTQQRSGKSEARKVSSNEQKPKSRTSRKRYKDFQADLLAQLERTQAHLAAAQGKNQQLKDMETALTTMDDHLAYMSSILARSHLSCCFLPSTWVGPHPVQATINLVTASAWGGRHPPEEWISAFSKVPTDYIIRLDVDFMSRMQSMVAQWKHSDAATQAHLTAAMTTALSTRSNITTVITRSAPFVMKEVWSKTLPPPPTTEEGKRIQEKLYQVVADMEFTEEQKDAIKAAISEYRDSNELTTKQIVSAHQAIAAVQKLSCNMGTWETASTHDPSTTDQKAPPHANNMDGLNMQSNAHLACTEYIEAIRDAQIRAVMAFGKLANANNNIVTWPQFAYLNFNMRCSGPYIVDAVDFCQAVEAVSVKK